MTLAISSAVEQRPVARGVRDQRGAMTSADFDRLWPRFSGRLASALRDDGRALRREGVRLQLEMSVCADQGAGVVLNAAVTLLRGELRDTCVAGLHVTDLPERRDERSLATLSHELTSVAEAWLGSGQPSSEFRVFVYPKEE